MKATIKDVAKAAGVSISTVSYAINGNERISETTRQRVLDVVKELNYVANRNAKLLKQKKTRTIGLFFNSWFSPIYSDTVHSIEKTVHKMGYDLVACSLYGEEHSTAYKYLRDGMVDGAVFLTSSFDDKFLHAVASEDLPMVVLNQQIQGLHIYNVLIDHYGGAYTATKALISSGCREVYYFSGSPGSYDNQQRLDGYSAALACFNIEFNSEFIVHAELTEESGYQQMKALLEKGVVPRAIFSSSDEMAIGIIRASREHGITVPGDLKLVGFNDIPESGFTVPALTTVSYHKSKMGSLAAEILFSAINGNSDIDSHNIISTCLIKRDSF